MTTKRPWALFAAYLCLAAGCVSTTSGVIPVTPDDDNAAQQYFQLGARYFHNGNYELARDRLLRAIELDPHHSNAHMTLALTYEQLDNERLAVEHYEKAVRYDSRNFNARNAYAVFLCGKGRYDDASEQFKRAVEVPENDDAEIMLTNAGVCMLHKPDYDQAEKFFRAALDRKNDYGEALLQLASLKFNAEDYLQSRAFIQRFLATNPSTPGALFLAVETEKALDDESASKEYADRLVREFPDSVAARRVLKER